MRLIDADACPALFDVNFKATKRLIFDGEKHFDNLAEGFMEANNVIRSMPTIDAAQVVHGRWIDFTGLLFEPDKCSVCGGLASNTENMKYCPNCGAKMDLPEDGE